MIKADLLLKQDEYLWKNESDPTTEFLNTYDEKNLVQQIESRIHFFNYAILRTIQNARVPLEQATKEIARWIKNEEIVRVIGAGRARLAAAIPANRLHHAGARVFVVHDTIPLPNTYYGGAIIAASASGQTPDVLEMMKQAKERNGQIRIIGIASESATQFKSLCDIFIPIDERFNPINNPLKALADTGEHIISELLDAIIVAAALSIGKTDEDFRRGHEDLGPTGPYRPKEATELLFNDSAVKTDYEPNLITLVKVLSLSRSKLISHELLQSVIEIIEKNEETDKLINLLIQRNYLQVHPQPNSYYLNITYTSEDRKLFEYHQILFSAYQQITRGEIELSQEMVYHSLQYDDFDSAYGCVFNTGNLEIWFNLGQSEKIISLMEEFNEKIIFYESRRQAKIHIAKAEAYSSISNHLAAIDCLKQAFQCIPYDDNTSESIETRRTVWRLAGISSGDLGKTHNAMGYYRKAISEDLTCNDPKTSLCMGYLGYLYADQQKFDLAQKWVFLALQGCPEYRSPHVYSKNLSNAGLVQLYNGDIMKAIEYFDKAQKISERFENEGGDVREYGRIQCHKGLAMFPLMRQSETLVNHLIEAEQACQKSGDIRRGLIANGFKSIALCQCGDEKGITELIICIKNLVSIMDYRNSLFFSLSLVYLQLPKNISEEQFYHSINNTWTSFGIDEFDLLQYLSEVKHLANFWWNCMRPIIFHKSLLIDLDKLA